MANNEARIVLTAKDETGSAFASAKSGMAGLGQAAQGIEARIAGLGANFAVLGGAIAGALSVESLRGAVNVLDELDDLAEKTGIATDQLAALRYAGEAVGTPLDALGTGVRKLSVNMAAAAGGAKEQGAVFDTLGIKLKNLDGSLRGSDAVLGDIANKFASFRDGPEKAALAIELFGKSGADMIPLLNQGAAGIERLRGEAEKLGVAYGTDLAKSAADFNDNLKKLALSSEGFRVSIAGGLLPTLNELTGAMLEAKDGSSSLAQTLGQGLAVGLQTVVVLAANVAYVLKGIGTEIGAIGAQAVALAKLDINGFNAISAAVKEDGVRARAELDALERRILGLATSTAGAGRGTAADPRSLGAVASIEAQTKAWKDAAPVIARAGEAAKATADEFQNLYNKITGKSAGIDADFGKNIATLRAGLDAGKISLQQYVAVVEQYARQQPYVVAAAKAEADAYKARLEVSEELAAAYVAESKAREQGRLAVDAYIQSISESNDQLQLELSLFGKSARDRDVAIEQYRIELDLKKQLAAINANPGFNQDQRDEEIARASAAAATAKNAAVIKADLTEMQRLFGIFDNTAHEVFVNIFNDGSNAFKKLGQSLKAGLIDVLYELTLKRWIINVAANITGASGALGFSGAANAATTGSSLFSSVSNIGSFGTAGASLLGGLGGAAGIAGNAALASSLGLGVGEAAAAAAAAGVAGGASAATAGIASTLGSSLAPLIAAAPYLAAVAGVIMLAKNLDHSGTPHTGAGTSYSAAGGLQQASAGAVFNSGFTGIDYSANTEQFTTGIVKSVVGILDSTATTFGKAAGYQAAASFADDSSKDGAWGSLFIRNLQGVIADWQAGGASFRTFSDGTAGNNEYLAAISADVRKALDGIGLPAWATSMLDALGAAPSLDQLAGVVTQINATQVALGKMGDSLVGFADLSDGAVAALIKAAGGIDNLASAASTYYDNFYTSAEKAANTTSQITAALGEFGLAMPATREQFRALVEQQQALGESGAPAVAALLKVSGAFASVVPATEAVVDAIGNVTTAAQTLDEAIAALRNPTRTTEDIAKSIVGLQDTGASLAVELLRAQGNTAGADAAQYAIDTAGMSEAERAIFDYNAALRTQITTLQESTAAAQQQAQSIASLKATSANLQVELLRAQGDIAGANAAQYKIDTAGMSEAERAVFDYNLRLREQIAALQESSAAAQAAAQAQQQAAEAQARSLANLRATTASLEIDLMRAQGNTKGADAAQYKIDTAGMSAAELAIFDYNASLKSQITALQEQAQAAQAAAAASQQLKAAWQNLTDSIADEVARIRGLVTGDSGMGYAALQAQFAITTARARAGDQSAAALLPQMSRQLLDLAATNAATLAELRLIQASTAASLDTTVGKLSGAYSLRVPSLDGGTNYVPHDMLVMAHKGEAVIPAPYNVPTGSAADNTARLEAAIERLTAEVAALKASAAATATSSGKTAAMLDQVTQGGTAMLCETA